MKTYDQWSKEYMEKSKGELPSPAEAWDAAIEAMKEAESKHESTETDFSRLPEIAEEFKDLNLTEICRKLVENDDRYIEAPYELIDALKEENFFASIPQVANDHSEIEDVNFENSQLIDLKHNWISLMACGDWQPPTYFTMTFKNGRLWYDENTAQSGEYKDNIHMDINALLKILYEDGNIPQSVKERIS